jgi:hypothetical protein
MLTAIEIENFKGISEPVRLELRPITLLFGQNSAGKSSLLHALIYAREVFERHNLDADRTLSAGEHLDLGGFRTFVHDHDLKNPIRLRFELNLDGIDLPGAWEYYGDENIRDPEYRYLSSQVKTAEVGVTIAWADREGEPFVRTYEVGINGRRIGRILCPVPGKGARILDLDGEHPVFNVKPFAGIDPPATPDYFRNLLDDTRRWITPVGETGAIGVQDQQDALPDFDRLEGRTLYHLVIQAADDEKNWEGDTPEFYEQRPRLILLERILYQLLVGPGLLLRDVLKQFRYIGPQRRVPPRDYSPPRIPDPAGWANGMAGWDLLFTRPTLVERISRLLSDPQRLNLDYTLEQVEFREFESRDRLLTALKTNSIDDIEDVEGLLKKAKTRPRLLFRTIESPEVTLEPADVGVGVSQMIPAFAAALDDQPIGSATLPVQLVAIEHPELNLHPRLQAELAEVFLRGALAEATKGRIFFIETHSEVFTLRLFRRIRESHKRKSGLPPGDGRGDGAGNGDGRGDGSGAGYADGTGDGRGDGSGAGYGDGTGGGGESVLSVKPTDVAVWYVDRSIGLVSVKQILVDVEGEFVQPWPDDDSLFEQDFRERYT